MCPLELIGHHSADVAIQGSLLCLVSARVRFEFRSFVDALWFLQIAFFYNVALSGLEDCHN